MVIHLWINCFYSIINMLISFSFPRVVDKTVEFIWFIHILFLH
jgi:hypothetical protein